MSRLFATDALAAILSVLEEAGRELTAPQIKAALRARGVTPERLRSWASIRPRLASHGQVRVGGDSHHRTYQFIGRAVTPSPLDALALLAGQRLSAARRAELADVVRAALSIPDTRLSTSGVVSARLDRVLLPLLQALAQMAIEVEELATNAASARAVIHTVRALAKLADLHPVERAGESTQFDRSRHVSVGRPIPDGATVVVVRPGYTWNRPDAETLIARAVVQDRSTR